MTDVNQENDPAQLAKEKLATRKEHFSKLKRRIRFLIGSIAVCIVLLITLVGFGTYYAVMEYGVGNMHRKLDVVYKDCVFELKTTTVHGKREYTYHYTELFGYRFYDSSRTTEKTRFQVRGEPVRLIGLEGLRAKYQLNVGQGLRIDQLLEPAQAYVFIYERSQGVITHESFCK